MRFCRRGVAFVAAMKQPLSVAVKKQFYMLAREKAWKTRDSPSRSNSSPTKKAVDFKGFMSVEITVYTFSQKLA